MIQEERFRHLLQRYVQEKITAPEQDELFELIATHQYDQLLENLITADLGKARDSAAPGLPPHISQEIMRNILSAEKMTARVIPARKKIRRLWLGAAASFLLMVMAFMYYFMSSKHSPGNYAAFIPGRTVVERNNSDTSRLIQLKDGSRVTLQPESALYYPAQFTDSNREVYLEGRAFFEVTKNPQKPFLVFTTRIVTRVLGTSFYVDTHARDGHEEVSVRTGRVQVSENNKSREDNKPASSIIVTPNQKVVYEPENRLFETRLVEEPQPIPAENGPNTLPAPPPTPHLVYDQEKLGNIFRQLAEIYGIDIVVENPSINECSFTGDLSEEDLYTKLKSICLATRSNFQVSGTKILISGKGCD